MIMKMKEKLIYQLLLLALVLKERYVCKVNSFSRPLLTEFYVICYFL